MKRLVKLGSRLVPLWLLLVVVLTIAVVVAAVIIGTIDIGYKITPTPAESPTMTPNPLNLDLGTIPSGSSDDVDFGKVATLDLPAGYEITFTLDLTTTTDFSTFDVDIVIYVAGEPYASYWIYLYNNELFNSDSRIIDAGSYDVQVSITYTANSVAVETTGTVKVDVSYPG